MKSIFLLAILLIALTSCTTSPAVLPTQAPLPTVGLPTLVLPTPVPPTATATLIPTAVPSPNLPLPTVAGTRTVASATTTIPSTPTATRVAASPTIVVAPGLYVTGLRTVPDPPTRDALEFYATFLNTTGSQQNYRWVVYVYKADAPNKSTGETTRTTTTIPVGASEQKSLGNWKLGAGGGCEFFFARVAFFNENNAPIPFNQINGKIFEKVFSIC